MLRQYYSTESANDLLNRPGVLALVSFDQPCRAPTSAPIIATGLKSLSGPRVEVIEYAAEAAARGVDYDCHWSCIDDVACVATWMSPEQCRDINEATEAAYARLLQWISRAGYPHPFRIWNFLPKINLGEGDCETYKQFCVGRQRAFDRSALASQQFPAASALGHHGDGAVVYMLASKSAGRHHENPKQQPAYRYPRCYGPASPSFARATSIELQARRNIMISGTASILGHDTQAAGDLRQQLGVTLDNIRNLQASINPAATDLSGVRVYLRDAGDLDYTRSYLQQYIAPEKMIFVHADICRANLSVEIEALANEPSYQ